ncbi:MAG: GNAT family N-acetyltransferase [Richelia sp. RM2_1_2]|nr:GNAT family N-acetyltransferase [Richelia sp. SM1_7_0]NJN10387.1 GNAT family N-acetyltransferase [Richelia sp. RM1_1_1]NJO28934.1 GNAT family N-acetyltransferase [Richelia sp. SL_2_1]NJO60938.1 GNAT family N-acetyltransferase [Richelia sp. RM2_1_2]
MKLHRFDDTNLFYQKTKDYLLKDEVLHNLQLGIMNRLMNNPDRFKNKPYLAVIEHDGNIIAVAMMTIPHNLLLSKIKELAAIDVIINDLRRDNKSLTNINAPVIEAQAFAEKWCLFTGKSYQLKEKLRIYKLEKVELFLQAEGNFRLATIKDKELLKNWHDAFCLEALGCIESDSETWVEARLKQGITYFWENEIPVSLASSGRFTPNGGGINTVYTPPEHRKQGYAGACVAALSQTLLDKGYKFCFLFTDLSNQTSNKIYQQIGYKSVADWNNYSFSTSS